MLNEVGVVISSGRPESFDGKFRLRRGDRRHRDAPAANVLGDGPGVDPLDAGDAVFCQERAKRTTGAPVRRHFAGFPDDDSGYLHPIGLEVVVIDAVVPDQRVGEGDDLARVARIVEDLLVAGHPGVEDDLANGIALRPQRLALIDGTVA